MARRIANLRLFRRRRHCRNAVARLSKSKWVGLEGPRSAVRSLQRISCVFIIIFGVHSICGLSNAFAQQLGEATRDISFWAYRVGNGNWSDIHFEAKPGEVDTLKVGKYIKGRIHKYSGSSSLNFFREEAAPTSKDPERMVRIPIAQTKIPTGIDTAILFFSAASSENPQEFNIHLVNADPSTFPSNSIRVFNSTGVRLAGKVGQENSYFEQGISEAFSLVPFQDQGIPVAFLVETEEGPKFVFEKDLKYAANRRVILLLEAPRRKGSYKIQATNLIEMVE